MEHTFVKLTSTIQEVEKIYLRLIVDSNKAKGTPLAPYYEGKAAAYREVLIELRILLSQLYLPN